MNEIRVLTHLHLKDVLLCVRIIKTKKLTNISTTQLNIHNT